MPTFLEKDRAVLDSLAQWARLQKSQDRQNDFARPMDIGGRGTSGHSQALTRLVKLGLAERRQRIDTGNYIPMRSRSSWEYRITTHGIAKLDHRN
jgi:hypothetical protein